MSSKLKFWNHLEELIQKIHLEEKNFIGGDLNGHVGKEVNDFKSIHGGYGFRETNEGGKTILDFSLAYEFVIANKFLRKEMSISSPIRMDLVKLRLIIFL